MEKTRKTRRILLFVLVGIVAITTIAFAAIQTTLRIVGTAEMQTISWEVKFENLSSSPSLVGGAGVITAPSISSNYTQISGFNLKLTKPNDSVAYTFDVTNSGTLDAKIGTFTKKNPVCVGLSEIPANKTVDETLVCDNLNYSLTYSLGGDAVSTGDKLAAGVTKNLTLVVSYGDEDDTQEILPEAYVEIADLDITILYIKDN